MTSLHDVKDECSKCGKFLECELCLQGHAIGRERENIVEMVRCQMEHEKRMKEKYEHE